MDVGFVGAGGIGQDLIVAIRKFYYSDVSAILLMIVATVMAIIIEIVIGISAGILAGIRRGRFADSLVTVSTLLVISIPVFVIGSLARTSMSSSWFFGGAGSQ